MLKLKNKDNKGFLESGRLEILLPDSYFEHKLSSIHGEFVESLGFAIYRFYEKPSSDKPTKIGVLNVPTKIVLYPTDILQNQTIQVHKTSDPISYTVLTFEAGTPVLLLNTIHDLSNVDLFMGALFGGHIDTNIPYDLLAPAWIQNLLLNDEDLGINFTIMSVIVSELCRYKKDKSKKFAEVIAKDPSIPMTDYTFVNFREICANSSVLAALAFEDMNSMLDSALNMTREEKEQSISPLEQMLTI